MCVCVRAPKETIAGAPVSENGVGRLEQSALEFGRSQDGEGSGSRHRSG